MLPHLRSFADRLALLWPGAKYLIGSAVTSDEPRDFDIVVIDIAGQWLKESGIHVVNWRVAGGNILFKGVVIDLKIMEQKLAERGGFLRGPLLRLDG